MLSDWCGLGLLPRRLWPAFPTAAFGLESAQFGRD
jgi:hypothetical protein